MEDKELEKMKQDESPKDSETPSAEEKEKETEAEDKAGGDAGSEEKKEGSSGKKKDPKDTQIEELIPTIDDMYASRN